MGLISRWRTLSLLDRIYGLQGQDRPPTDLGTASPVVVVHDVSREAELEPIKYVTLEHQVEATAVSYLSGVGTVTLVGIKEQQLLGDVTEDAEWQPWILGVGSSQDVSADFSDASFFVRAQATPDWVGYCERYVAASTGPIALTTGSFLYPGKVVPNPCSFPIYAPWSSEVGCRVNCLAIDAGKFFRIDWQLALVRGGLTPPGMR